MLFRRSLALSFSQLFTSVLIELVSLVILARILTPKDMGVFAAALAIILVMQFVGSFGLYEYLIQKDKITVALRRSVIGLSGFLCIFGCLILLGGTWLAAQMSINAELREVVIILTAVLIVHPFNFLPVVLLQREMRYGALYIMKVVSSAIYAGVAIYLALKGFGAASLAWALVASTTVYAVIGNIYTGFAFIVSPSRANWGEIVRVAHTFTLIGAANRISESGVILVVGQVLGFSALGLFTRARDLLMQLNRLIREGLMPVLIPFLANQARAGENLKQAYLTKVSHLSVLCWPLGGFLILFADPIIRALLGENWLGVIPILRVLSVSVLIMPFGAAVYSFVIALSLQRSFLPITIIVSCLRIAAVGLMGMISLPLAAAGFIAAEIANAIWVNRLIKRSLEFEVADIWNSIRASGIITLASLIVPFAMAQLLNGQMLHDVLVMAGAGSASGLSWLIGIWLFGHPLKAEITGFFGATRAARGTVRGTAP